MLGFVQASMQISMSEHLEPKYDIVEPTRYRPYLG